MFVLATLALVPASLLTALAGFFFGPLWGTLLISPIGVLSATLAFFAGRTIARPWVRRRLERQPRLAAIDAAVAQHGFRIIFFLRLASFIPFAPLSYVLGSSRVCGRDFVLASWLGLLPGTVLYTYLGSLASSAGQIFNDGHTKTEGARQVFYLGGLVLISITLMVIAKIAHRALKTIISKEASHDRST